MLILLYIVNNTLNWIISREYTDLSFVLLLRNDFSLFCLG